MNIRQIWSRLATTSYARTLECEIARERMINERLRAENRALLNSILGIAGIPPLPASTEDLALIQDQPGWLPPNPITHAIGSRRRVNDPGRPTGTIPAVAPATPPSGRPARQPSASPRVAAPMRRRSWPQIHRMLEFESAQKEKQAIDVSANGRA